MLTSQLGQNCDLGEGEVVTYPETSVDHGFQFLFGYFTAPSVSSSALRPQTGFLCARGELLHFL